MRWRPGLSSGQRGILAIAGGSATGQLLGLAAMPLLSRWYSPHDFGLLAVVTALASTIAVISCGRMELVVPLPAADREAADVLRLALALCLVVLLVGLAVVGVFRSSASVLLNQEGSGGWLWAVPVVGSLMAATFTLNQWAVRQQRFTAVGRRTVLQNSTMLGTQLVGGFAGVGPVGLLVGLGAGYAAGGLGLLKGSGLRHLWRGTQERNKGLARSRALLRRHWRFPVLLGPAGLLNVLGLQLPVLLVSAWYGGEVAGWLGMTQRVTALPVALIGAAVAQVFLSYVTRAVRADLARAMNLFRRASAHLALLGAGLCAVLLVGAPWLFERVLGPQWVASGEFARALAVGVAAQLVASPLSQTLIALERIAWQLWLDLVRVLGVVATVGLAVRLDADPVTAMWALGLCNLIVYGLTWVMSRAALVAALRGSPVAMAPLRTESYVSATRDGTVRRPGGVPHTHLPHPSPPRHPLDAAPEDREERS